MSEIIRLERVRDSCLRYHVECQNELVTVVDYSTVENMRLELMSMGFYLIVLKESYDGPITYGLSKYQYQNGSLLFVAPNQIFGIDGGVQEAPLGYALLFHQNLFRGINGAVTRLKESKFFNYENNEALQLNDNEREIVLNSFTGIINELRSPLDHHTNKIVASLIMALLSYIERFDDRQLAERKEINHELYVKFNKILEDYYTMVLLRQWVFLQYSIAQENCR